MPVRRQKTSISAMRHGQADADTDDNDNDLPSHPRTRIRRDDTP